jgi:hypothetical protein
MVSNMMTGLIGGIGANSDGLADREKRPQRGSRTAAGSLGDGSGNREQRPKRTALGKSASADGPGAREQRPQRPSRRGVGLSASGDGSGGREQRPQRSSPKRAQAPDRREWWEGD